MTPTAWSRLKKWQKIFFRDISGQGHHSKTGVSRIRHAILAYNEVSKKSIIRINADNRGELYLDLDELRKCEQETKDIFCRELNKKEVATYVDSESAEGSLLEEKYVGYPEKNSMTVEFVSHDSSDTSFSEDLKIEPVSSMTEMRPSPITFKLGSSNFSLLVSANKHIAWDNL